MLSFALETLVIFCILAKDVGDVLKVCVVYPRFLPTFLSKSAGKKGPADSSPYRIAAP